MGIDTQYYIQEINGALNQLDFYRILKAAIQALELDAALLLNMNDWPHSNNIPTLISAISNLEISKSNIENFEINADDELFSAMRSSHSPRIWNAEKTKQSLSFIGQLEKQTALTIPLHAANGKHYAMLGVGQVLTNDHDALKNFSFLSSLYFDRYYETILLANEMPIATSREIEIINAMSMGKTPSNIAIELGVSMRTIDADISRLQQKLHVNNPEQLVAESLRVGLIR